MNEPTAPTGTTARSVPTTTRLVWRPDGDRLARTPDELAVEEPLEIRVDTSAATGADAASVGAAADRTGVETVNVTMRTPGHDFELALGWLLAEGIIHGPADVSAVRYCTDVDLDGEQQYNIVTVDLSLGAATRRRDEGGPARRLTMTNNSCGVCGSASIEALTAMGVPAIAAGPAFELEAVLRWPSLVRPHQAGFATTGGLHAAGLVTRTGEVLAVREDVGRHNAVDKVAGFALLEAMAGRVSLPRGDAGLVVSGRISFEIVQKALCLGVPVLAAVSAASGLAARLADEKGLALVGFVRGGSATVYTHPERLAGH